jgi:CubicO group peptidase (beta-lactamase class C family)
MKLLTGIIVLLSQLSVFGQNPLSGLQVRQLDSIATQDVPAGAPGIATAIIQNGKLIYQKLAGYANLADSSLISPETRFNIASNGKQFTALAILVLESQRKLGLSDDIRKYLPDLFKGIQQKITIENLLTHTSGIRDVYDLWSLKGITWWKNTFNNQDVLSLLKAQQSLNFTPGAAYLYSNSNYILLAQIVQNLSGKPFANFLNELFQKLRMPGTSFEPDFTRIRGPVAYPYFNFNTWTAYKWIWNACGDGNLFSTLNDQVQWEKLLQGKARCEIDQKLLAKSQELVNPLLTVKYGYGLEFGMYKGLNYRFHEGATGAWKATVIRFPERNISMITLTNSGKTIPYSQTRQMADVMFALKNDAAFFMTRPPKTGDAVNVEEILGTYVTENNFAFEFLKKNDDLYLRRNGRNDVKLEREAGNIFRQANDRDFKQEFTKNASGEMQVTAYYTSHAPYTLTRPAANWSGFDLKGLDGNYYNDETGAALVIQHQDNKTYLVSIGNKSDTMKGNLILPGRLLVGNYAINIEGGVNSKTLFLDGDRIKRVRFTTK